MTDIIRLNEAINDYAARPVITRIGEPILAIRPSTYLGALGASTNIDPEQILIDGSFGQTGNPTPFIGVGEGAMTIKSDENGVYLSMPQIGIRTGIVMDSGEDKGTLVIMKYRLNDIFEGATRVLSIGQGGAGTANFSIATNFTTKNVLWSTTVLRPQDNLVHTIAMYRGPEGYYILDDNIRYDAANGGASVPNIITGAGINTSAGANTTPNDLDLYSYELYLDVSLSDQQVVDYLKTF